MLCSLPWFQFETQSHNNFYQVAQGPGQQVTREIGFRFPVSRNVAMGIQSMENGKIGKSGMKEKPEPKCRVGVCVVIV